MTKPPFHNDISPKVQLLEGRRKKEQWKGTKNSVPACNGNTLEACYAGHMRQSVSSSIDSTIDYKNVNVLLCGLLDQQDEGSDLYNYSIHKTITLPV
jgi:hypothetical protein